MAKSEYSVVTRVARPDIAGERRYAAMEAELAKRELEKLPARSWLPFSYPGLGLLRRKDWQGYIHALEKYELELERHESQMKAGLVPISFDVIHAGERPDERIQVHVMVERGLIHAAKKAPARPHRIDGAPNKSDRTRFFGFEGFTRRGIHIGRHGVEAEFSRVEAQDSALLVNHPLYIDVRADTRLRYEIVSRNLPDGQSGDVSLRQG
jgi:hypothetical protein